IVPKHVVGAGVDINVWENIVGSGPFKIKQARRNDSVTFEKNGKYFKPGLPYLDGLKVVIITDQGTAAAAIKSGQITMTTAVLSKRCVGPPTRTRSRRRSAVAIMPWQRRS